MGFWDDGESGVEAELSEGRVGQREDRSQEGSENGSRVSPNPMPSSQLWSPILNSGHRSEEIQRGYQGFTNVPLPQRHSGGCPGHTRCSSGMAAFLGGVQDLGLSCPSHLRILELNKIFLET